MSFKRWYQDNFQNSNSLIENKVVGGSIGSILGVLIGSFAKSHGVDLPAEVTAAVGAAIVGWLVPNSRDSRQSVDV